MSDWIGRTLGAVAEIKVGPGVLGRLGSVIIASLIVLAVIAVVVGLATGDLNGLLTIVYLVSGLSALYLIVAFIYALLQPEAAAMESAHLMQYRLKDMGAKNVTLEGRAKEMLSMQPTTNPNDKPVGEDD